MSWRIVDWRKHFENNRTKELKKMDWVPLPNRMDDDGYIELVDHPQGALHFAAWIAIVEIASRCSPRGSLMRDAIRPHTCSSISKISRLPEDIFTSAIPRLMEIGWIEQLTVRDIKELQAKTEIPQEGAGIPQVPAVPPEVIPQEGAGIPQVPAVPPEVIPQEGAALRERAQLRKVEKESKEDILPDAAKIAAGKNPGLELVEPETSILDLAIKETAIRIHAIHPARRRDCSAAVLETKLRAILKRHVKNKSPTEKIRFLAETEAAHANKAASFDWKKDNGEFAKSLENHFAPTQDRYLSGGPENFLPGVSLSDLPGHMNPGLVGGDW